MDYNIKLDFNRLKNLLILLTIIEGTYLAIVFTNARLWIKLDDEYYANYIVSIFHFVVAGIFIWYNWKKMPITKSKKSDNTWLILFLGIIGMWIWMPNKQQLEEMVTS